MNKILILASVIVFSVSSSVRAAALQFQSGPQQVPLLELYTSEGCSSCPPAEEWLNRLANSPDVWSSVVPVAFHVDYWNSLGWKDALSAPEYSQRQRSYAGLWQSDNVYTPCFVLDGAEWTGWPGRRGVPATGNGNAGMLAIRTTDTNLWTVVYEPQGTAGGPYVVHAAILGGNLDSIVRAGENRGRNLHHEFAVLDLVQIGMTATNSTIRGKFLLNPARFAAAKSLAVAVWVTRGDELKPLQATGGWLAQSPVVKK